MTISLIVGLGNPGHDYELTRHNAGAWFVERLARRFSIPLSPDSKAQGLTGRGRIHGHDIRLLIPATFMNHSGRSTSAVANFYKIPVEHMLVAHDELDLPPGSIRLKAGGGHGGHNGLRDIIAQHGNNRNFLRLRIGIGHPGHASQVTGFVLGKPASEEQQRIDEAIDAAIDVLPTLLDEGLSKAMNRLNGFQPTH